MSLSEKLKSLGVKIGARDLPPPRPRRRHHPIEGVVPGRFWPTPGGDVFVVETRYPPHFRQGNSGLYVAPPLRIIARWAGDARLVGMDPARLVFLDTETTGLAGGTGTYVFQVGVGCYADQGFRLAQFFMRDPIEEPALLEAVADFLRGHQGLVTFNGRAFDVPLLNSRYTLNGMPSPLTGVKIASPVTELTNASSLPVMSCPEKPDRSLSTTAMVPSSATATPCTLSRFPPNSRSDRSSSEALTYCSRFGEMMTPDVRLTVLSSGRSSIQEVRTPTVSGKSPWVIGRRSS